MTVSPVFSSLMGFVLVSESMVASAPTQSFGNRRCIFVSVATSDLAASVDAIETVEIAVAQMHANVSARLRIDALSEE
ncbi:Uncharacterised protein [Corynebacterium kutscheri]|uniref:Uncharacterized protein n=1 Tax=Corynebacterium kutscheri TaxID=35755 RepID=A0A0F6TDX9_9CORY|nr:hypothetical protein [Corynebacterium kutscheri]AKE41931.1 hypothetical protein UL82_08920 [Corynebacterium kutscheri]VEH06434.1 Uncharacterised protein [Corynebacterium kutscheri]VEH10266.1 Uncharacterised protein [Corynebacterium kutscheri]VEH82351.1 Uncharacterised protein [Corynebacterium kutscheri]